MQLSREYDPTSSGDPTELLLTSPLANHPYLQLEPAALPHGGSPTSHALGRRAHAHVCKYVESPCACFVAHAALAWGSSL